MHSVSKPRATTGSIGRFQPTRASQPTTTRPTRTSPPGKAQRPPAEHGFDRIVQAVTVLLFEVMKIERAHALGPPRTSGPRVGPCRSAATSPRLSHPDRAAPRRGPADLREVRHAHGDEPLPPGGHPAAVVAALAPTSVVLSVWLSTTALDGVPGLSNGAPRPGLGPSPGPSPAAGVSSGTTERAPNAHHTQDGPGCLERASDAEGPEPALRALEASYCPENERRREVVAEASDGYAPRRARTYNSPSKGQRSAATPNRALQQAGKTLGRFSELPTRCRVPGPIGFSGRRKAGLRSMRGEV